MSRFLVAAAFVAALVPGTTPSFAQPPAPSFAQPAAAPAAASARSSYRPEAPLRTRVWLALAAARAQNLARFHAYAQAGVFPSNVYRMGALHVWRDQAGHFCAAANLVRLSGATDLVVKIAENDNFVHLAEVTSGPLMDWMLTSGFTQEEVALIQQPYMPVADRPVAAPAHPVPIDPELRTAETARMRALYAKIEVKLERDTGKSLDVAVDRVMAHAALVAQLLAPAPALPAVAQAEPAHRVRL